MGSAEAGRMVGLGTDTPMRPSRCRPFDRLLRHAVFAPSGLRFDLKTFDRELFLAECIVAKDECEAIDRMFGPKRWWTWPEEGGEGEGASWWHNPVETVVSLVYVHRSELER